MSVDSWLRCAACLSFNNIYTELWITDSAARAGNSFYYFTHVWIVSGDNCCFSLCSKKTFLIRWYFVNNVDNDEWSESEDKHRQCNDGWRDVRRQGLILSSVFICAWNGPREWEWGNLRKPVSGREGLVRCVVMSSLSGLSPLTSLTASVLAASVRLFTQYIF